MSGGSYDYLCFKSEDELVNGEWMLETMARALSDAGIEDAAQETLELLLHIRATKVRIRAVQSRLQGVWKAKEWLDSVDWGPEALTEAVAKYRGIATTDTEARGKGGEG